MNKLVAYIVVGMPLIFGAVTAAGAQTMNEIGSATGVDISYTGSSLTLTGGSGSYSTHNGSTVGTTYSNTVETFYSDATGTSTFTSLGGSPASGNGQQFGAGYFTIDSNGAAVLGGTFTGSALSEGSLGGNDDGEFLMSGLDYTGTAFPTGYSANNTLNQGSLTFNYTPNANGSFNTSDASAYYAVKSGPAAVPELSPVAILGIGSLGLFGMLFAQGKSKRSGRAV